MADLPRLVQILHCAEADPAYLALDSAGRLWESDGIGSDRLSRPLMSWRPVRTTFEDPAPGDA